MKVSIQAGKTSESINVFISDSSSTTGAGLTGLAYNTASLVAYYSFTGANATSVQITLATLATITTAWASGGFKEIDATNMPGWYRLDLPNAVLASSKGRVVSLLLKGATNMAPCPVEIELTGWDNQDAVRGGITALPNAAAAASNGLIINGTNAAGAFPAPGVQFFVLRYSSTSHILDIFIQDSRTGLGLTGLVYNSAGLSAYYANEGQGNAGGTAISLVTATLGTFSSGGFKEKDPTNLPGVYELHLPNAALSTSTNRHGAVYLSGAANMAPCKIIYTQMAMGIDSSSAAANVTAWSGTSVASPDTAGYPKVTIKSGSGAGELDFTSGVVKSNMVQILASAITGTAANIVAAFTKFFNVSSPTGTVNSLPDAVPGNTGALILIGTGTRDISPNAGGVPLSTTGRQQILDADLSLAVTSGTLGYAIANYLTGNAYTVVNSGTYGNAALNTLLGTIAGYIDTEVAAIKANTDNLPSDPADASDIAGAFSTVNSTLATIAGYIDTEVAAIKAKTDLIPASPAAVGSAMTLADNAITSAKIQDGAITDAKFTAPSLTNAPTGILGMIRRVCAEILNKQTFNRSTGAKKTYADDGSTTLGTQACSDDGTTQTRGASS